MKKISLIIPAYNTDAFIKECLTSVQNQSYTDLEVIIIDDGSTDSTREKIQTFTKQDHRFHLVTHEKPKGVASSRNLGLSHATGAFIYFLDSDDFLHPEALHDLILHSEGQDVVAGRMLQSNKRDSFEYESTEPIEYTVKRKKLFKNRSILHRLIRREMIGHSPFNETYRYFSDLALIVQLLNDTETVTYVKSSVYFKRRRAIGEGIAIMQEPLEGKVKQLSLIFNQLVTGDLTDYSRQYLVTVILSYYRKSIVAFIKKDAAHLDLIYDDLYKLMQPIRKDELKNKSVVLKREISALQKGNKSDYQKLMRVHNRLRNIKHAFSKTKLRSFYRRFVFKLGTILPQKKKLVIFESFHGKQFSDNPRAIYEYMQAHHPDYQLVWSVDREASEALSVYQLNMLSRFSFKWLITLPRAKYWIFNTRIPLWINKPKRITYLQTWHGTPLKKLGIDIMNVTMPGTNTEKYKANFQRASSRWDYLISPNAYSTEIFTRAFGFTGEVLETGYPRNDVLTTNNNETTINKIKEAIGLPKDKKIILYAPTWRDNQFHKKGAYRFQLELDLKRFKETYGDEAILLLRMHYLIADAIELDGYDGIVYDMSRYSDIRELYLISDALITDYSSVFFDFGKLKRPILFFVYDLDVYRDQLRGFYLDFYKSAPGPLLETNDQLFSELDQVMNDTYQQPKTFEPFYQTYCQLEDGQATARVVSHLLKNKSVD